MQSNVTIPHLNANETEVKLNGWLKTEGEKIEKGDILANLETSKATFEIESPADGYLLIKLAAGKKYAVGEIIAVVFSTFSELEIFRMANPVISLISEELLITDAARKMMEHHGIKEEELVKRGLTLVREEDIHEMVKNSEDGFIKISEHQRAVSRTVSLSKSTIPDAFLLKKIYCDNALSSLLVFNQKNNRMAGLPELLVFLISKLTTDFPIFFSERISDSQIKKSNSAEIGITMDFGKGLFIPVVRNAETKNMIEISDLLMEYKAKAYKQRFVANDLVPGNFTFSFNMEPDTILVKPIIFPGQSCILSIGSILKETEMTDDGKITSRKYFLAGITYDHRIINGFAANLFLTTIKKQIENLEDILV